MRKIILFIVGVMMFGALDITFAQDTVVTTNNDTLIFSESDTLISMNGDTLVIANRDSLTSKLSIADEVKTRKDKLEELFSVGKIVSAIIVLIFTFIFSKLLVFLLGRLAETQSAYRLLIKKLIPFLRILTWAVALFIIIAGIIDPPVQTLITVGASVGLAVGFAAQDILKNIFGGFIIVLDSPFQVGDKIEIGEYYGEVTGIGLRSTRIVTPDDSLVTVPNADIVNNAVSNSNTGALDCQVVSSIYLPADSNISQVKEIAYKAAISSRYVYLNKPVVVVSENKVIDKNYIIHLKVKAYVLDIRYEFLLKGEITELILSELNRRELLPNSVPLSVKQTEE